jgi:hypothetical protein
MARTIAVATLSRRRLIAMLGTVGAVHAAVLVTSEFEGPGSAQLRVSQGAANYGTDAAVAAIVSEPIVVAEIAPTRAADIPTAIPPTPAHPTAEPSIAPAAPAPPPTLVPATVAVPTAIPTIAPLTAAPVVAAQPTMAPVAPSPSPVPRAVTQTMPGGRNNYVPGAPMVPNLGTGFVVSGTVVDATSGRPLPRTRVQIWLNTTRGGEREPSNRGSVVTDELGKYQLETSPVVPVFGQPHVHVAYDDGKFGTLFLRPVLKTEKDTRIAVDFALGPIATV